MCTSTVSNHVVLLITNLLTILYVSCFRSSSSEGGSETVEDEAEKYESNNEDAKDDKAEEKDKEDNCKDDKGKGKGVLVMHPGKSVDLDAPHTSEDNKKATIQEQLSKINKRLEEIKNNKEKERSIRELRALSKKIVKVSRNRLATKNVELEDENEPQNEEEQSTSGEERHHDDKIPVVIVID